jgi:uncharacterized protein YndB with AHSA1/START domain
MFSTSVTISIHASPEAIWDAITNPRLVKQYFFGTELHTDWRVGSKLAFRGEWEGKRYEDRGTVLAFDPPRSLSFNYWSSFSGLEDIPERRQIIRYEVDERDDGVQVTVHQSNVDTQERADHSAQNWRSVLEGLKAFVERQS